MKIGMQVINSCKHCFNNNQLNLLTSSVIKLIKIKVSIIMIFNQQKVQIIILTYTEAQVLKVVHTFNIFKKKLFGKEAPITSQHS